MTVDAENYFEIAEALHCWLSLNHEGQFSDTYAWLCGSKFKPGPMWSEQRVVEENDYYPEINSKNVEKTFKDLETLLNDREELQ